MLGEEEPGVSGEQRRDKIRQRARKIERREKRKGLEMHFHVDTVLPVLLAILSVPSGSRARRVAPLIEDDWARRPHRAAGKLSFLRFN